MKFKISKLSIVAVMALGTTSSLMATNGDLMIGQGAKARAMGGTGIAKKFGAESALVNPANITSVKDSEASVAVTYFAPDIELGSNTKANINNVMGANMMAIGANDPTMVVPGGSSNVIKGDSGSENSIIPEIYYATRLNKNFVLGLAIAGTAGMGVDYTAQTENGAFGMMTALSLLKVATPIAYQHGSFSIGFTPIFQYGSFEVRHDTMPTGVRENGVSTDYNFGYAVGTNYEIDGLSLGAVYKSAIDMTYKDTLGPSINDFGAASTISSGDRLEQPAEVGVGIAYEFNGNTITADYKTILWGESKGYREFGWENQNVMALGYEYSNKGWAFRAGYNYGKSPIVEKDGATYEGAVQNFFNIAGFPGIVEEHYTIGMGYDINEALTFDTSFIYAPSVNLSYDTTGLTQGATYNFSQMYGADQATAGAVSSNAASSSVDINHAQMSLTMALSYRF